jgi:hypothetical protein
VIVWLAFIGVVLVAVVVLGFCGYELRWKVARLRQDLAGLTALSADLAATQVELDVVRTRAQSLTGSGS